MRRIAFIAAALVVQTALAGAALGQAGGGAGSGSGGTGTGGTGGATGAGSTGTATRGAAGVQSPAGPARGSSLDNQGPGATSGSLDRGGAGDSAITGGILRGAPDQPFNNRSSGAGSLDRMDRRDPRGTLGGSGDRRASGRDLDDRRTRPGEPRNQFGPRGGPGSRLAEPADDRDPRRRMTRRPLDSNGRRTDNFGSGDSAVEPLIDAPAPRSLSMQFETPGAYEDYIYGRYRAPARNAYRDAARRADFNRRAAGYR